MSLFPVSLSEWPYFTKKSRYNHVKWGNCGLIAVSNGSVLSILAIKGDRIEPVQAFNPLNCHISCISWCDGIFDHGVSPPIIFVGGINGSCIVIDVIRRIKISIISLKEGYVTSVIWSQLNPRGFFFCTSIGNVYYAAIHTFEEFLENVPNSSVIWMISMRIPFNQIMVSPHDNDCLLCYSNTGAVVVFDHIHSQDAANVKIVMEYTHIETEGPVMYQFYPISSQFLVLICSTAIYLLSLVNRSLSTLIALNDNYEPIIGVFFIPNDESVIYLIHSTNIRLFMFNTQSFDQNNFIKLLLPLKSSPHHVISMCSKGQRFIVLTKGLTLHLFQIISGKLRCQVIYRGLFSKPSDFDIHNGSVVFGTSNGYLQVTALNDEKTDEQKVCSCAIRKCMFIGKGSVRSVLFASSHHVIAVLENKSNQKVFFIDLLKMSQTSVLNPSHEIFGQTPVKVMISPLGNFFAVTSGGGCVVQVFPIESFNGLAIATVFRPGQLFFAFSDKKDEFWVLSHDWIGMRYVISNNGTKGVEKTQLSERRGEPSAIVCLSGYLLIGSTCGDIFIVNWDGGVMRTFSLSKDRSIVSIEVNPSRSQAIIVDSYNDVFVATYTGDGFDFTPYTLKIRLIKWVSNDYILAHFIGNHYISCVQISDLNSRYQGFSSELLDTHVLSDADHRAEILMGYLKSKPKLSDAILYMEDLGFGGISTILRSGTDLISPLSYSSGNLKEQQKRIIKLLNKIIYRGEISPSRNILFRNTILIDEFQAAFSLLITADPSEDSFRTTVMKASFISNDVHNPALPAVIAALIDGGYTSDAFDLLLLSKQYNQAARLMLSHGQIETAVQVGISKMSMREYNELVLNISQQLSNDGRHHSASSILIGSGQYMKALDFIDESQEILRMVVSRLTRDTENEIIVDF